MVVSTQRLFGSIEDSRSTLEFTTRVVVSSPHLSLTSRLLDCLRATSTSTTCVSIPESDLIDRDFVQQSLKPPAFHSDHRCHFDSNATGSARRMRIDRGSSSVRQASQSMIFYIQPNLAVPNYGDTQPQETHRKALRFDIVRCDESRC